jgi:hypothetical protein
MAVNTHQVLGTTVTMPVRIRTASAFTAMFSVPAAPTQRMVDYAGLQVLQPLPRRSAVALAFVRYVDGDLGPYDEFALAVLVRNHDDPTPATTPGNLRALVGGRTGVPIHRLPVNGEFTRAAGRSIWGFPKELAEFDTHRSSRREHAVLRQHGRLAVDMSVDVGVPVPLPRGGTSMRAYSHLDGVTRFTKWQMNPGLLRVRPGGVRLRLGDHPIGQELAELGLPRRALLSTSMGALRMTFGDAEPVV